MGGTTKGTAAYVKEDRSGIGNIACSVVTLVLRNRDVWGAQRKELLLG